MAIQIVMDQTGDTRQWFNPDDTKAAFKGRRALQVFDHCRLHSGRARRRESDCNTFV